MKTIFLFLTMLFSCSSFAAGIDDGDSVTTSELKESKMKHEEEVLKKDKYRIKKKTKAIAMKTYDVTKDFVMGKLRNYLDSSGVKGTDPTYIGLPKRKWRVSLTGDMDDIVVDVENTAKEGNKTWSFDLKVRPPMSASSGMWVGYMGYGFGFSYFKTGQNSTNLALNLAAPRYSINVRWIRSNTDHKLKGWTEKGMSYQDLVNSRDYGYKIESWGVVGDWIFNKR